MLRPSVPKNRRHRRPEGPPIPSDVRRVGGSVFSSCSSRRPHSRTVAGAIDHLNTCFIFGLAWGALGAYLARSISRSLRSRSFGMAWLLSLQRRGAAMSPGGARVSAGLYPNKKSWNHSNQALVVGLPSGLEHVLSRPPKMGYRWFIGSRDPRPDPPLAER